jgi:hypothetical protein
MLPNDETEQDRLDLHHHVFRLILRGTLFRAPINNMDVHRVLDFGTGTGIWAVRFLLTDIDFESGLQLGYQICSLFDGVIDGMGFTKTLSQS